MDIEICTTKRKLTKSLIAQMRFASEQELSSGTPMGFIINGRKGISKIYLIKYLDNYFIFPATYKKHDISVACPAGFHRKIGTLWSTIKFDTPEKCDEWWAIYQKVGDKAIDQIYI